ncbi:MAG TPA: FAD-dependent oxidoreductase [Erwinia persicina]|uniref:FAD-dependent oxidoreductase n=1 Tax=Erwinia persicina TaxID=55211 RepID=A0A3S7S1K0_9GAMM|nr:FAD-dependent oxidoreductase [Erwinia persicina]AXU94580.1 FAD-dependent oxidoreductase [Erwinia persicina]MBD8108971.1 FAD-dependent oxidoreductase [Erwinia persicina]MBD8212070.1 FAD-dependent oxidoreductase [Erwinia persicina]MCQ4104774.1 FAD-dependent oxidoreductase [Erwinia persicina]QZQ51712.1 FAD-dependent oxidoreductase [Erwinia persicina]
MRTSEEWDVIIIGAGPIGLSSAWNYARNNKQHNVLVLDKYSLMTQLAGTSGEERHWRLQYSEIDIFRLTLAADTLWQALEKEADRRLIHRTGSLWFGDADVWTNEGQITQTMASMDEMGLPYERLGIRAIEQRYGFSHFDANYEGFLQQDGGVIDVRGTLSTLYALASELNVSFGFGQDVLALEPDSRGVTVIGANQRFRARKVLVASGPGSKKLLRGLDIDLELATYEMACISMLRSQRTRANDPFWFAFQQPVESDSNLFYGFPPNPWSVNGFDRLGTDFEVDPIAGNQEPAYRANPQHVARALEFARRHMPFLAPDRQHSSSSCLAVLPTNPQRQFYLDSARGRCHGGENVVVSAGGWAFKFTPLMGQVCADLLSDHAPRWDISALRF